MLKGSNFSVTSLAEGGRRCHRQIAVAPPSHEATAQEAVETTVVAGAPAFGNCKKRYR